MIPRILKLFFHAVFFAIFLVFSFFVGLFLTPFYIYRLCLSFLAKVFLPDSVEIVSPLESTLGEDNLTRCPKSAICGVLVLTGPTTLAEITKLFENKLVTLKSENSKHVKLCYPRFQQYPEKWLGYSFWKWDRDFRIENHIRVHDQRNTITTEDDIITEIGNLRMRPFRKKLPLWEILYVENYLSKSDIENNNAEMVGGELKNYETISNMSKTALIFRVHHMMADGYSLMTAFMQDLCGKNIDYSNQVVKNDKNSIISKVKVVWKMSNYVTRIPYLLLRQYLVDIDFHIWCSWESKLTHEMLSYWTDKIPVAIIKEISKRNKVSFTSVLLAGIAGGVNKYFIKNNMEQRIPRVMRAIAAAPVNGHPFDGFCNHWTFAVIPLPTGSSTPKGRLHNANKAVDDVKKAPTPLVNYYLMFVMGVLPSWVIKTFGKAYFGTAVMSNFPGPTAEIKFGQEFPIEDMAFWPIFYRGRAGLGFTMLSYMDGVRISITIDKAHINTTAGVSELAQCIRQEFDVMNVPELNTSQKPD